MTSMDAKGSRIRDVVRDSKILRDTPSRFDHTSDTFWRDSHQTVTGLRHHLNYGHHRVGRDVARTTKVGVAAGFQHQSYSTRESNKRRFRSILPIYSGSMFIEDLWDWIDDIEEYFVETQTPERLKCRIASYTLEGEADCWWCQLEHHRFSWWRMKHLMAERFIHTRCSTKLPNKKEMEEIKTLNSNFLSDTCLMKWASPLCNSSQSEEFVRNSSEVYYRTTSVTVIGVTPTAANYVKQDGNGGGVVKQVGVDNLPPTRCSTKVLLELHNKHEEEKVAEQTSLDKSVEHCMIVGAQEEILAANLPEKIEHRVDDVSEDKKDVKNMQDCDEKDIKELTLKHNVNLKESIKPLINAPMLLHRFLNVLKAQDLELPFEAWRQRRPRIMQWLLGFSVVMKFFLDDNSNMTSPIFGKYIHPNYITQIVSFLFDPGGVIAKMESFGNYPFLSLLGILLDCTVPRIDVTTEVFPFRSDGTGSSRMMLKDKIGERKDLCLCAQIGHHLEDVAVSTGKCRLRLLQVSSAGPIIKDCKFIIVQELAELQDQLKVVDFLKLQDQLRGHELDDSVKNEFRFQGSGESYDILNEELKSRSTSELLRELVHGSNVLLKILLELTLTVDSLLSSKDAVLMRHLLYDVVISIDYSFLPSADRCLQAFLEEFVWSYLARRCEFDKVTAVRNRKTLFWMLLSWYRTFGADIKLVVFLFDPGGSTCLLGIWSLKNYFLFCTNILHSVGNYDIRMGFKVDWRGVSCLCTWLGNMCPKIKSEIEMLFGLANCCGEIDVVYIMMIQHAINRLDKEDKDSSNAFCREDKRPAQGFLLVCHYISGGNLEHYLHEKKRGVKRGNALPWSVRYKVAVGIAEAIGYLHNGTDRCILHRDIKPSNILHSSKKLAKLCDFGLATWTSAPSVPFLYKTVKGTKFKEPEPKVAATGMDFQISFTLGNEDKLDEIRRFENSPTSRRLFSVGDQKGIGFNLTRGRVIPWERWNDTNNTNMERKLIMGEMSVVIIDAFGNVSWKNGQLRESLKLFHNVMNGLDPPVYEIDLSAVYPIYKTLIVAGSTLYHLLDDAQTRGIKLEDEFVILGADGDDAVSLQDILKMRVIFVN